MILRKALFVLGGVVLTYGALEGIFWGLEIGRVDPYQRRYSFQKTGAPKTPEHVVAASLNPSVLIRPQAVWPPAPERIIDYSQRNPSGLWNPKGYYLNPNFKGTSMASTTNGEVLYKVEVQTDAYGRREHPREKGKPKEKCVVVLGDSIVYGEGVEAEQALPGQIESLLKDTQVYNYGIPAAGPMKLLARIQDIRGTGEITQKSCTTIYVFLPDHVRKANLSLFLYETNKHSPFFVGVPGKETFLRFNEGILEAHPFLSQVFEILSHSRVLGSIRFNYPIQLGSEAYQKTAALISEIQKVSANHWPNSQFVVVLFPDRELSGSFKSYLEDRRIPYLDYEETELVKVTTGSPFIKEPHLLEYGSGTYAWLAKRIVNDLNLSKK